MKGFGGGCERLFMIAGGCGELLSVGQGSEGCERLQTVVQIAASHSMMRESQRV